MTSIVVAEEQSEEDEVMANLTRIYEAVNEKDLDKYRDNVTVDLVNMTRHENGDVTSTVGAQTRLDELETFYETSPYTRNALMVPVEILVDGDRAFALIDGTLKFIPKPKTAVRGYTLKVDLYLFFHKVKEYGWQTERSMAVVKGCSTETAEADCVYYAGGLHRGGDDVTGER
jgi:hypothetical protein